MKNLGTCVLQVLRFGKLLQLSVAALVAMGTSSCAEAQPASYPNRPIKIVVPYPPGGSGDVVARSVGQRLTDDWREQVIVDNRSGASGMVGTQYVATSPADGYTLLLGTDIQFAINPVLYSKIPYDPVKDFEPVALGAVIEFALAVPTTSPVTSVKELIAMAKGKPGKLFFGSAGSGSTHHLTMELIKQLAGINVTHVPYKGGAQALPDLISGQIQMMYVGVAQVLPQLKAGRLKMLAVGSPTRLPTLPNVPALSETFPNFESQGRWDFYAPAGTPRDIVNKLHGAIRAALTSPMTAEKLASQGLNVLPDDSQGPAERNRADTLKWKRVITQANIKVD